MGTLVLNMNKCLAWATLLVGITLNGALVECQQLTIQTDGGKQTVLTRAEIEALPRTNAATSASDTFAGVSLMALLEKTGFSLGGSLRGKRLASCLLVEAADGYRVVFALPEIDPAFTDKQIVLAYLKNGKPLDEKEGPYRVVIPDEKKMARWIRQVTTLKIVDVQ
jgi:hypothetical protein